MLEPCQTSISLTTSKSWTCDDDDDHDQLVTITTVAITEVVQIHYDGDDNSVNVHDSNSEQFPQNNNST